VVKVNHPLWKQRYDINEARIQDCRPPYLIGSFFCVAESLSQLQPLLTFFYIMLVFLGMFTMWIYLMERAKVNFDIMIMIDHVLSSFFSVPPADLKALQTITGRNIKILIGFFSMCYTAVVGWTFGFRVTEHAQTVKDLTQDLDSYIFYCPDNWYEPTVTIQRWWRKQRTFLKVGKLKISDSYQRGDTGSKRSILGPIKENRT